MALGLAAAGYAALPLLAGLAFLAGLLAHLTLRQMRRSQ
jgi:hypothetical protein